MTAEARTPDGRTDESIGSVWIENLAGEPGANAMMKAETKAKRRVTLSICGLGMLDETEVESFAPQVHPQRKAITETVEAPDASAVQEYVGLLNECRNQAEATELAARVKADKGLTEPGLAHLRPLFTRALKELPAVVENQESEPVIPY